MDQQRGDLSRYGLLSPLLGVAERLSMATDKQALHNAISEPERISHPVRHKVQQLFADGYS